jgi:hypothetical protein
MNKDTMNTAPKMLPNAYKNYSLKTLCIQFLVNTASNLDVIKQRLPHDVENDINNTILINQIISTLKNDPSFARHSMQPGTFRIMQNEVNSNEFKIYEAEPVDEPPTARKVAHYPKLRYTLTLTSDACLELFNEDNHSAVNKDSINHILQYVFSKETINKINTIKPFFTPTADEQMKQRFSF